jgi:hypothetical protein
MMKASTQNLCLPNAVDELRYFSFPILWRVRIASLDEKMMPSTFSPHAAAAEVASKLVEGVVSLAPWSAAPAAYGLFDQGF